MKRVALLLVALSVAVFSQVSPVSVPDIAGTGVAASVASVLPAQGIPDPGTVRFIQFVAPASNTGTVRVGDSKITTTRGIPLAAGAGYNTPTWCSGSINDCKTYTAAWYFLVQSGDKVSIVLGR